MEVGSNDFRPDQKERRGQISQMPNAALQQFFNN